MPVPEHCRLTTIALMTVERERYRQLDLKAAGRFAYTPSDKELTNPQRLAMLTEEVGEVARETLAIEGLVQEPPDFEKLLKELTQVAAISVAWIEHLEGAISDDGQRIGQSP